MKKTFSIFFLGLFLFNVGGYYVVFWALRYHSDQKLVSILDAGSYNENETIELKIPVSLPYPVHPRGFERVNGEFEIDGKYFTLIEQKLQNDTLHIVIMRDVQEENLVETMTQYANLANDLPQSAQNAMTLLGKIIKDFNTVPAVPVFEAAPGLSNPVTYHELSTSLLTRENEIASPPPRS